MEYKRYFLQLFKNV